MTRRLSALLLALLAAPGLAAQDAAAIAGACGGATNLPPEICACMGARAEDTLDETQRALLHAMLAGDEAGAATLRAQLPPAALIATATFVTDAPVACAGG